MSTKRLARAAAMMGRVAAVVVGAALGLSLSQAAAANAEKFVFSHSFGAGDFEGVWGIAVDNSPSVSDPSAGDVYIADLGGEHIVKFNATGSELLGELKFTPTPAQEAEGLKAIGFPLWVAVDPASGDVYASSVFGFVVTKFSATGVFVSQITESALPEEKGGHPVIRAGFAPGGIAVAPSGDELYVADRSNHVVDRFSAAGEYEMQFPDETVESGFASSITTGPAGEVYVTEQAGAVREFSSSGVPVIKAPCTTKHCGLKRRAIDRAGPLQWCSVLAEESAGFDIARYSPVVLGGEHDIRRRALPRKRSHGDRGSAHSHVVYAGNSEGGDVGVSDPVGTRFHPPSPACAKHITPTSAELCGTVDPMSETLEASYQFQYGVKETYRQLHPRLPREIGTGKKQKSLHDRGKPQTRRTYHFRSSRATPKGQRRR